MFELMNAETGYLPPGFNPFETTQFESVPAVNHVNFVPEAGQMLTDFLHNDGVTTIVVGWIVSGDMAEPHE